MLNILIDFADRAVIVHTLNEHLRKRPVHDSIVSVSFSITDHRVQKLSVAFGHE